MTDAVKLMRILALSDSAFPVGAFAFSAGLESAVEHRIVTDAASLEAYARQILRQAAFTDGIAALQAHRSAAEEDYDGICEADAQLLLCKMNAESRLMTLRMGRKLAELSERILNDCTAARLAADIRAGTTPGTYPVAQAVVASACEIPEKWLFASLGYGAINMVLGATLRCLRISHYDTQRIMFRLGDQVETIYDRAREMTFDDMSAFVPQIDIVASLHEKGTKRMFMN